MLNFIKNWTLPIAMLAGVLGYLLFVHVPLLEPTKSLVNQLIAFLTPSLIFAQLFFWRYGQFVQKSWEYFFEKMDSLLI